MTTIKDDWDDKTPAESVGAATKLAHRAAKHARAADQRTLEIFGVVNETNAIAKAVLVPRQPRSNIERYLTMAAAAAIVVYVLVHLAPKLALAMP